MHRTIELRSAICKKSNNKRLQNILTKNCSSAFFTDKFISFSNPHDVASSLADDEGYALVDDYRDYIDRMVCDGEENLVTGATIIFYASSSRTTAKSKFLPVPELMLEHMSVYMKIAQSVIWRSFFLLSFPSSQQQQRFQLYNGKNVKLFQRTKNDIPHGSLSQVFSLFPFDPSTKTSMSGLHMLAVNLIEEIANFEVNAFVQLVFALSVPDIYSYSTLFAPAFIHTVKVIRNYYEEISLCISSGNFDHSSLVRDNIHDNELKTDK